ncbi:MAG TPA: response regulator transcription factor [Acidobacteriota bacterium]|nr:response regulator transcription factor [Acidobacteriota bacterium]
MRNKKTGAPARRVRIVVLEEHKLYREGLCLLLSRHPGFELIGAVSDWDAVVALARDEQPDIIVAATAAGDAAVSKYLPETAAVSEDIRVLILAKTHDPEFNRRVVRLGASGILSNDKPAEMLIKAIECIHAGEAWLDRSTTASLLRELTPGYRAAKKDPFEKKIASLTGREQEVIRLVGKGLKNKQIAEKLFISDITVHHHLTSIYSKLDVADRFELLIFSYRNGLAEVPS